MINCTSRSTILIARRRALAGWLIALSNFIKRLSTTASRLGSRLCISARLVFVQEAWAAASPSAPNLTDSSAGTVTVQRASMENTMSVALRRVAPRPQCVATQAGLLNVSLLLVADGDLELRVTPNPGVKTLVDWLKSIPVDQDTILKVSSLLLLLFVCLFVAFCFTRSCAGHAWSCFLAALSRVHLGLPPAHGLQGRPDVLQNKVSCLRASLVTPPVHAAMDKTKVAFCLLSLPSFK